MTAHFSNVPRPEFPKPSRWAVFKIRVSYIWSTWMFRLFVHRKETCRAAVCSICNRYLA